jgi:hypothetical protein
MQATDVQDLLANLGSGTTEYELQNILSKCADSIVGDERKGEKARVTITLNLSRNSESDSALNIEAKIGYTHPTKNGKVSEEKIAKGVHFYYHQTGIVSEPITLDPDAQLD